MEIFNLYGDEWNVTTEHEGFAFKDSWVGARIGGDPAYQGHWRLAGRGRCRGDLDPGGGEVGGDEGGDPAGVGARRDGQAD